MLLALALTAFAQSIDAKDALPGHVTALPPMTATRAPARSLEQESSTLWASGATVEVMEDGLLLDGDLLVRFSAWGRSRHSEEVSGAEPFFDCVPTPFDGGGCVVGPTWAHEGIDVWWAELDAGLELGWTVYEPPVGPGPLTLHLDLEGALMVRAEGESAQVLSASQRLWSVGRTVAWDADGVELPTLLREADGGLEVVVDDSKARYPIVVDPLVTTPRARLSGPAGGQYGLALVSGDFSADGSQDLAVGDPVNNTVRIYRGDRIFGGLSTTAAYTYTGSNEFGAMLDMGDINGDGRDDLVIGSHGREFAVVLGTSGTPPIERFTLPTNSDLGVDLSAGSDINGDGFDDIVLQETGGRVHVCYGDDDATLVDCLQTIGGISQYSRFSSAEDLDGDGYGDFVVGDWMAERIYTFFGRPAGIVAGASTFYNTSQFAGLSNTDLFGYRIEARGDLNGDGRNDIVAANMLGNQLVIVTNAELHSFSYSVINFSYQTADFGSAVEMGDLNGDGRDDLIVGARDFHEVFVFHGHPTQLIDAASPVMYYDEGRSNTFGDEELAVIDDNNSHAPALLAIGSYSTNQVMVYDGWRDNDNDGYGPTDCNDNDATVNPGATEIAGNSVDENCSGTLACYVDADNDNYRTATVVEAPPFVSCGSMGYGVSTDGIDCNDSAANVNPGVTEVVGSGVDEDCDAFELCYLDVDRDGRRSTSTVRTNTVSCTLASHALATAQVDCNDLDAATFPGANEVIGNGVDNDCDGLEICYQDIDNDGARTDLILIGGGPNSCTGAGQGLATDPIDCNDGNAAIHPSAMEMPGDGVDSNCTGLENCYIDADQDGARSTFARTTTSIDCSLPDLALAADPIDCNDASNTIFPGATDAVADGVDSDCDGSEACYVDADLDGARSSTTRASTSITCASADLALAADPVDCNDTSSAIHPGATEGPGDGVDSDCDGSEACYVDADLDGARSSSTRLAATLSCSAPDLATAADPVDCDDADDAAYPGAPDAVADGVDSSCDGLETCYVDADLDGARSDVTRLSSSVDCGDADLALATAPADCDDADPFYNSTCPVFFLRPPTPGTAGAANTIRIEGATPGARVVLLGGRPGTTFVPCGTFVDMVAPNLLSSGVANAAGVVTFTVTPPPTLAGRTVTLQAAMPAACAVSSSYVWTL
jgi:hypothetical protein